MSRFRYFTVSSGAIPDDDSVVIATNQGEALAASESLAGQAFSNICRRIYGEAVQIRIADKAARSTITKYSDQTEYKPEPKIAYIKENHIHVEPMSQDTWDAVYGSAEKI